MIIIITVLLDSTAIGGCKETFPLVPLICIGFD